MSESLLDEPRIAECARLACLAEATAPKPGNVHPSCSFADMSYAHFVAAAEEIGRSFMLGAHGRVGEVILRATIAAMDANRVNTSLGTILLLAPLAAVPTDIKLDAAIGSVLAALDAKDTRDVYQAIRAANPGGLGSAPEADVRDEAPREPLPEVMQLAADRDLVARQYVCNFADVFWLADQIRWTCHRGTPLLEAIVRGQLRALARWPDSLIARKCGLATAQATSRRAAAVLENYGYNQESGVAATKRFDNWLRGDGHRRNPGTTADLIAAALFVLLREGTLAVDSCQAAIDEATSLPQRSTSQHSP